MLNESFIQLCFELVCSLQKKEYKSVNVHSIFTELYNLISTYIERTQNEKYPVEYTDKLYMLRLALKLRLNLSDDIDINSFISSITVLKYSKYEDFLKSCCKEITEENLSFIYNKVILPKVNMLYMYNKSVNLKDLLNKMEYGEFDNFDELYEAWDGEIKKCQENISKINKEKLISDVASLDLLNGDYTHVLNKYKHMASVDNIITTGFTALDKVLPHGGLEPKRLYIFAGETGVGKSIILQNILANHIEFITQNNLKSTDDKPNVYLYITAENLIDESLLRYYCCSTQMPYSEVINKLEIDETFDFKNDIVSSLKKANTNILFFYVPARIVELKDIETLITQSASQYNLCGVFLDYLDLIRSGSNLELRLELGEITLGLKRIAIEYDIPIVTATQLNRSGYNNAIPTLTSIGESIKKATDSDFIAFLQHTEKDKIKYMSELNEEIEGTLIRLTVLKNRNGPTGTSSNLFLKKLTNGYSSFNYKFTEMINMADLAIIEDPDEFKVKATQPTI